MVLLKLFGSFLKTGCLAIGGAYSFLPLLERELIDKYQWLSKEEFLDIAGIVTVLPGAISIKYATYTGYKIAGIPGVLAANAGNILGPLILILIAGKFYLKYKEVSAVKSAFNAIQLAVFSMIIVVAFQLINVNQLIQVKTFIIIACCFVIFMFTKIHPGLIILGIGILGVIFKV